MERKNNKNESRMSMKAEKFYEDFHYKVRSVRLFQLWTFKHHCVWSLWKTLLFLKWFIQRYSKRAFLADRLILLELKNIRNFEWRTYEIAGHNEYCIDNLRIVI